jgi:hypothetical protein
MVQAHGDSAETHDPKVTSHAVGGEIVVLIAGAYEVLLDPSILRLDASLDGVGQVTCRDSRPVPFDQRPQHTPKKLGSAGDALLAFDPGRFGGEWGGEELAVSSGRRPRRDIDPGVLRARLEHGHANVP